jgi:serine/threonine-protein kinase
MQHARQTVNPGTTVGPSAQGAAALQPVSPETAETLAAQEADAWLANWLQRAPSQPDLSARFARGELSSQILQPTADTLNPETFGRYQVGFQIAYGGTAAVHLGLLEGPSGLRRPVAMKRVRAGIPEQREFRVALSDEALLGTYVRHPNVVPIFDLVEAEGELLLVMEYVVGETLAHLQRAARQLPVGIVIAIMSGALRGLHAAHIARGSADERLQIVHRDVSPQNVLVGADGIARIMDFGMARAISTEPTNPGLVKGKIGYLAPEQIANDAIDARTDVFAAGIVIWEALARRRLFQETSAVRGMLRFLRGKVPPASSFNPEVPKALDRLLARALELSPSKRFASAEEFADALEEAARPASTSEVARFVERHVGLSIEMQRTLLRGLQNQAQRPKRLSNPPEARPTPAGGARLVSALEFEEDTRRVPPEIEITTRRLLPELKGAMSGVAPESEEATRLFTSPRVHAVQPGELEADELDESGVRAKDTGLDSGPRATTWDARTCLIAALIGLSIAAGFTIERWTRRAVAPETFEPPAQLVSD